MKVLTKITDTISKVAEWIIMAMILGLVGLIVTELCRRNFLNQSWLPTTELCGILFCGWHLSASSPCTTSPV